LRWVEIIDNWLEWDDRSRNWLADKVWVSRYHLRQCMNGERQPSMELLKRIELVTRLPEGFLRQTFLEEV
jgi:hypothetical protein